MLRRCVWSRNIKNRCSIYIYDISNLRVKVWILQIFCATPWTRGTAPSLYLYLSKKIQREKDMDILPFSEWDYIPWSQDSARPRLSGHSNWLLFHPSHVVPVCYFRHNPSLHRSHCPAIPTFVVLTLADLQLDAQNSDLFTYNIFIKILYMFRALLCSSLGGLRRNCIYAGFGIVIWRYQRLHIYNYDVDLLKMSRLMLETCRGV